MSEITKSRVLLVVPICPDCGKPVGTTKNDIAARHGFKRHKLAMNGMKPGKNLAIRQFSQEDGRPCSGSGKEVSYKNVFGKKGKLKRENKMERTVGISNFVKRQTVDSEFTHWDGTWDQLSLLATELLEDCERIENCKCNIFEAGYRDGVMDFCLRKPHGLPWG